MNSMSDEVPDLFPFGCSVIKRSSLSEGLENLKALNEGRLKVRDDMEGFIASQVAIKVDPKTIEELKGLGKELGKKLRECIKRKRNEQNNQRQQRSGL